MPPRGGAVRAGGTDREEQAGQRPPSHREALRAGCGRHGRPLPRVFKGMLTRAGGEEVVLWIGEASGAWWNH